MLLAFCSIGALGCHSPQDEQRITEEIVLSLINDLWVSRVKEIEKEAGLTLTLFVSIEGEDAPMRLLDAVRELGINASVGSEFKIDLGMHFTFKTLEVSENGNRKIEYAFIGYGGSGHTGNMARTNDGWKIIDGGGWMQ